MKKVLSLVLCLAMVFSLSVTAFAGEEEAPAGYSTEVTYNASTDEHYTVTVPATIVVHASGDPDTKYVTVAGAWPSNKHLVVTSDSTVTVKNDIDESNTKNLAITFQDDGIDVTGSNIAEFTSESDGCTKAISVANIEEALFGTWTGTFNYTVSLSEITPPVTD